MDDVKKPFYKRWYFWAVIILISLYFIGKSNEDSKYEETQEAIGTDEGLNEVAEQSSAENEQSDKPDVSAEELSAYEQKADLGSRCSAIYAVGYEVKNTNGDQDLAETDLKVSTASKLYAEKYAEKLGGTFNAGGKIAAYTKKYRGMVERAAQENVTPEEVDEVQSVMKKCDDSITAIVRDI